MILGWGVWGVGETEWYVVRSLFVHLCSDTDGYFFMKVKGNNLVNTYSCGPSLGYEAYYLILIPMWWLIFRLSGF